MRNGNAVADSCRAETLALQERLEHLALVTVGETLCMAAQLVESLLLAARPQSGRNSFRTEKFEPRHRVHRFAGDSHGAAACFSRRRSTGEGMRSDSGYLATVRRGRWIPSPLSCCTRASSDRMASPRSPSIICLMRWGTASEECGSSPAAPGMA